MIVLQNHQQQLSGNNSNKNVSENTLTQRFTETKYFLNDTILILKS